MIMIIDSHDNGCLDCLFHQDVLTVCFTLRKSNSIMSGSGKGCTFEELFRLNSIIVYFMYLGSKSIIGLSELFSIFFSILLKFYNWSQLVLYMK